MDNLEYVVVRRYSGVTARKTLLKVGSRNFQDEFDANNWRDYLNRSGEPHKNEWVVIAVPAGLIF